MSYKYRLEDLLALLHNRAPTLADAISVNRRKVEHGLLSVGLKLHCTGDTSAFDPLIEGLGGRKAIVEVNAYRQSASSMCLVLPPLGNAVSAIRLLEAMELATGAKIYKNPEIQIQICSPGRLNKARSAMLAIAFYLGSDQLRRYTLSQLDTTFSAFHKEAKVYDKYERGRRLVLYDAWGDFDREFPWWRRYQGQLHIDPQFPFEGGRTDLLTGTSAVDIANINLVATLLLHAQHGGYWAKLGNRFEVDMKELLHKHLLDHLLVAPWIRTDEAVEDGDLQFEAALQELMNYALEDVLRLNRVGRYAWKEHDGPIGILGDMRALLHKARRDLMTEAARLPQQGEST